MRIFKINKSAIAVVLTIIILILPFVLLFMFLYDPMAGTILPYEIIKKYTMYDHIIYENTEYYIMKQSASVPDEFIPFVDETVQVLLVDKSGKPYNEKKAEEAWLYANDNDKLFIYCGSTPYTKEKALASEHYGFETSK